jgi:hypothetical protein
MTIHANQICKIKLDATKFNEVQEFMLPTYSTPLSARWQGEELIVWYFSYPLLSKEPVLFYIALTGAKLKLPDIAFRHLETLHVANLALHILCSTHSPAESVREGEE